MSLPLFGDAKKIRKDGFMKTILNTKIDLSNYNEDELVIGNTGSLLTIQFVSNSGSAVSVLGKNIGAEDYVVLGGIDMATMSVISNISTDGLYNFDVSGVDKIKIDVDASNTTSIIYIKITD